MDLPEVLQGTILDDIVAWLLFIGAVYGFMRKRLFPLLERMAQFMDDYYGVEERPGVPGRLGVMQRLANQDHTLNRIETNLLPNGGSSAIDKVVAGQTEIRDRVERVRSDLEHLAGQFWRFTSESNEDRSQLHADQDELRRLVDADPCVRCPLIKNGVEDDGQEPMAKLF